VIITVSPNVALDRVRVIRGFQSGKQSRALFEFLQPGGSGVHASSVIQTLGGDSIALGFLGGHTGELWKAEAEKRGLNFDMVSIPNETRESFCLIDLDQGSVVESVVEGTNVASALKDTLLARLETYLPDAELLILSGSLPPELPLNLYSDMIEIAQRHSIQTLADIHSESLRNAISSHPWLIKPNLTEFHELIGYTTNGIVECARACLEICLDTGMAIALSMSEDGLMLSTSDEQWLLTLPSVKMSLPNGLGQNVIGCGDALVGTLAYEYGRTKNLLDAAKLGLASAHFNLSTFGVPEINAEQVRDLVGQVRVQDILH
jgi:1-phosphofructokinase family hexose kinase